jgi:MATE family multidrug resistance protein
MSTLETQVEPPAERRPLAELWSIAWPTILTMTSYTVMRFVDKLMVGQVGPTELTAQSNGGVWAFTMVVWTMGTITVINTYVAQHLGAKQPERGPQYGWAGIWLSVISWLVFLLPAAALMPLLFRAMGNHSAELQRLETGYAQILLCGSVLMLAGRAVGHYFFGMHRPKVVTVATVCANITNICLNYVLIFGEEGIRTWGIPGIPGTPALGVHGAAIGTVCGMAVEFIVPFAVFMGRKMNERYATRAAWRPRLKPIREVIRIGWPAGAQFGNEIICWAIFMSVLIGSFGEQHMAAGWIAFSYIGLSFLPAVGISVAVSSLVGKYIGAGEPDTAVARARLGLLLAVSYMTACGGAFLIFRHQLVAIFVGSEVAPDVAAEIVRIGGNMMICVAVFQTADAVGVVYSGALRGAGDTLWPSAATIIYSWVFILGAGWTLALLFPQLESIGPWIGAAVFIILFGVTMAWRFESGAWRKIQLLDRGPGGEVKPKYDPGPPLIEPDVEIRDLAEDFGESLADRADEPRAAADVARSGSGK